MTGRTEVAAGTGLGFRRPAGLVLLFAPSGLVIAVVIAMAGRIAMMRSADLREALPRTATFALRIVYIFGCWHTAVGLRAISSYWLLFGLALNWIGDTAAMLVGRSFGRHKMAPRASPGKSWEGAVASTVASLVFGVVYAHYLMPEVALWLAAVAGNVAGQAGDLCESAFKRGAGMKDSGTLLLGPGGWCWWFMSWCDCWGEECVPQ